MRSEANLKLSLRAFQQWHSTCTHWGQVDSQLLVVKSQIASLTPDPSFCHNSCCRCPNGSCEAIFDSFPMIWRTPQGEMFWPLQSNSEVSGVPKDSQAPISGVWVSSSHSSKSGVATPLGVICSSIPRFKRKMLWHFSPSLDLSLPLSLVHLSPSCLFWVFLFCNFLFHCLYCLSNVCVSFRKLIFFLWIYVCLGLGNPWCSIFESLYLCLS